MKRIWICQLPQELSKLSVNIKIVLEILQAVLEKLEKELLNFPLKVLFYSIF